MTADIIVHCENKECDRHLWAVSVPIERDDIGQRWVKDDDDMLCKECGEELYGDE